MKLKTNTGVEIDTDEIGQGFGDFGRYVRTYVDKNWGKAEEREAKGVKPYIVRLSGTATVSGIYTVDAEDEEQAKELAMKQKTMVDWDYDYGTEVDDVEVCDVEEQR